MDLTQNILYQECNMKKLPYVHSVIFLSLLVASCTKKTFEAMKEPASLIRINDSLEIRLINEPMKEGTTTWDRAVKSIDLEGVLRVNYKNNDFWFWQMKCPPGLKCSGEKVYLPVQATAMYDLEKMPFGKALPVMKDYSAYVIKKEDEANGLATLALASTVKNPLPEKFLPNLMTALINHYDPKSPLRRHIVENFFLIAQFSQWDKETAEKNVPLADFTSRYVHFAKGSKASGEAGASSFATDLYKFIVPEYENTLKQIVKDFPWTAVVYEKLAKNFAELRSFPGAQESIFMEMLSGGDIEVAQNKRGPIEKYLAFSKLMSLPYDFATKSAFQFKNIGEGLILKTQTGQTPLEFRCSLSVTDLGALGLQFELALEPNNDATSQAIAAALEAQQTAATAGQSVEGAKPKTEESLKPKASEPLRFTIAFWSKENSKYLNVYKKFDQDAKAMAKKVTPEDFTGGITHKSLFLFAIKYGEGGLDRSTGNFRYAVNLKKGKVYNTFLAMAKYKASSGSVSDTTYSGPVADGHIPMGGAGQQSANVNWYQSAQGGAYSFYIRGKIDVTYRSNSFSDSVDELCFEDNSLIIVEFDPAELQSGMPTVKAEFPTEGGICKSILSP
jgi:hypothetical protein